MREKIERYALDGLVRKALEAGGGVVEEGVLLEGREPTVVISLGLHISS